VLHLKTRWVAIGMEANQPKTALILVIFLVLYILGVGNQHGQKWPKLQPKPSQFYLGVSDRVCEHRLRLDVALVCDVSVDRPGHRVGSPRRVLQRIAGRPLPRRPFLDPPPGRRGQRVGARRRRRGLAASRWGLKPPNSNWAQRRIPSTNQHLSSMGTTWSIAHGVRVC